MASTGYRQVERTFIEPEKNVRFLNKNTGASNEGAIKVDFFKRLFGAVGSGSAQEANKRLKVILIHDRTDISPRLLDNLRREMIAVLTKYMDIDESKIEMDLDHDERAVALVANIPVLRIRRGSLDTPDADGQDSVPVSVEPAPAELTRAQNAPGRGRRHR
jgi:cell division topological specificity factor